MTCICFLVFSVDLKTFGASEFCALSSLPACFSSFSALCHPFCKMFSWSFWGPWEAGVCFCWCLEPKPGARTLRLVGEVDASPSCWAELEQMIYSLLYTRRDLCRLNGK